MIRSFNMGNHVVRKIRVELVDLRKLGSLTPDLIQVSMGVMLLIDETTNDLEGCCVTANYFKGIKIEPNDSLQIDEYRFLKEM